MNNIDLNNLRDRAYQCACDHGFHDTELSNDHLLMLVITELSEAVEADRKDKQAEVSKFKMDYERYPALADENKRFYCAFGKHIKDTVEDKLADAVIRLLYLAGLHDIDLSLTQTDIEINTYTLLPYYGRMEFTEIVYDIIREGIAQPVSFDVITDRSIFKIFSLAKSLKIDLLWHIEQKMKYNKLREQRHGKKY